VGGRARGRGVRKGGRRRGVARARAKGVELLGRWVQAGAGGGGGARCRGSALVAPRGAAVGPCPRQAGGGVGGRGVEANRLEQRRARRGGGGGGAAAAAPARAGRGLGCAGGALEAVLSGGGAYTEGRGSWPA
jgi:hypothetical protein